MHKFAFSVMTSWLLKMCPQGMDLADHQRVSWVRGVIYSFSGQQRILINMRSQFRNLIPRFISRTQILISPLAKLHKQYALSSFASLGRLLFNSAPPTSLIALCI